MKNIIAIGAHSDDLEFYAGGTLASLADDYNIYFVIATDGRNGFHDQKLADRLVKLRRKEQLKSAKELGVKKVIYLGFKDGELEDSRSKLKRELLKVFVKYSPEVVFSFDPEQQFIVHSDFHPDHRALALATIDVLLIDATLVAKGGNKDFHPKIFLYNANHPNYTVDINKTKDKKVKSLSYFVSQHDVILTGTANSSAVEKFAVYQNKHTV